MDANNLIRARRRRLASAGILRFCAHDAAPAAPGQVMPGANDEATIALFLTPTLDGEGRTGAMRDCLPLRPFPHCRSARASCRLCLEGQGDVVASTTADGGQGIGRG